MSNPVKRRPALTAIGAAIGAALLLHGGGAAALGLQQAYEAALSNDPTFRAAFYDSESGKEYQVVGRAGLLPSLNGSYNASHNVTDTRTVVGASARDDQPKYFSRSATVQLRQPLFNLDALARYKQGQAQSRYSAAQFNGQQQDLVVRLVSAYIDALYAGAQLDLAGAQRNTLVEQRKVNDHLFAKGEGTRTDMLETQSKLDLAEAQLLEARDNLSNSLGALSGIVGVEVAAVDALRPEFRVEPLAEGGLEAWKKLAVDNNPDLQAQLQGIEAARQEVNKSRAGHLPRVDFVAAYSRNTAETINTYNQDSTVRSVGVQVNIPLYAGGAVNASSRQAVAGLSKARSDLDAKTDKALVEVRKQYNIVVSSVARIEALVKAVESAKLLVRATEQSIKGGVRINLDLLNARQQMFSAQRDLAQARYGYLLAMVRLRAAAGVLGGDDVRRIAAYFN